MAINILATTSTWMFTFALISLTLTCSSRHEPENRRKYMLIIYGGEPTNWTTALARCQLSEMSPAASIPSRMTEYIQGVLDSRDYALNTSTGFWKGRAKDDSETLCPAVSTKTIPGGSYLDWKSQDNCSTLHQGVLCEGNAQSEAAIYCFGLCSKVFVE